MCGICGVLNFDRRQPVDEQALTTMRETLVHRGPDGFGNVVFGHVGLGHRRLSIVDVAGGHQPMSNEDRTVWVVFNGEIYNHAELRRSLLERGHDFRTRSDTEAILHLFEEKGDDFVQDLQGMFALAIYDLRRDRLLLARDRIGIKPLYYRLSREGLLFGSEIKAILAAPGVRAEVNWSRVPHLLRYGTVYGPESLFAGILELSPGHLLIVEGNAATIRRYWDLPQGPEVSDSEDEAQDRIEELLRRSIRRRLMSDVPIGVFLSGGLDSSLIVALMARLVDAPVKTFSIGFRDAGYNEFDFSREVAARFRTDHLEVLLDADRFFEALSGLIWYHDEPIALPASVPLFFLSRETKGRATVVLTGEGADELFLGYERYLWLARHARIAAQFQRLCPPLARAPLVRLARMALGPERMLLDRLLLDAGDIAASFHQYVEPWALPPLAGGELTTNGAASDASADAFRAAPLERDVLARATYMEFKTFLQALLMKQDKMSMAASIESRVPFLDHELVEYAFRLPTRFKLVGDVGKSVLKKVAARHLPERLVHRAKLGFPVPLTRWLDRPVTRRWFEEILLDPSTLSRGLFDRGWIEARLRRDRRGSDARGVLRSSYLIWNLVNFELWQRSFIDSGLATRPSGFGPVEASGAGATDARRFESGPGPA